MSLRGPRPLAVLLAGLAALPASAQLELAAPTPPSHRLPEPAAAAQQEVAKRIRDLYKEEYARRTPADLQALAQKLLKEGRATTDDADARYVLLREAKDLAAQAADTPTALAAVDLLARLYTVDATALRAAALVALERAVRTPETAGTLAEARLALVGEALAEDQVDAAAAHAAKAETAARAALDPALLARAQARAREIVEIKRELPLARAAEKTLEQKPDDPAAALAAGRWWGLVKGDWAKALPLLAKGSDAGLRAAAEKDLAKPASPAEQIAAADLWWDLAEKASGSAKAALTARALDGYRQAWPAVTALARARLRDRARGALLTRGLSPDPKAYKPPDAQPSGWEIDDRHAGHLDERFVHAGRFALRFANPPADDAIRLTGGPIPAAPGQTLTLRAWALTEGTKLEGDYLRVRFMDAKGESIDSEGVHAPPDTPFWTSIQRTVTCPAGTVRIQVSFRMSSPGGQVWLDDVSLKREGEGIELVENGSFERKEATK
jgi:hypothetical protein